MAIKKFPIEVVLTAAGCFVLGSVAWAKEVQDFVSQGDSRTAKMGLAEYADHAAQLVREQLPWLTDTEMSSLSARNWDSHLARWRAQHGDEIEISQPFVE